MTSPDTSKKRTSPGFYVLPKIPIPLRLLLIVLFVSCGIVLQSFNIIAGFIPVLAGILLTLLKPVSNNPKISGKDQGKWMNVTDNEYSRIKEHYVNTKRWANSYFSPFTGKGNLFSLILICFGAGVAYFFSRYSIVLVKIWCLDCGTFLVLFFLTGERQPYNPRILLLKIDAFMSLVQFLRKNPDPDLVIQPMLEINPLKKNADVPTDARLMLKFRTSPSEFMGIQIQISINQVGSKTFPYLYTVLLGRKGFDFRKRLSHISDSEIAEGIDKKYTLEPKQSGDVDILVFRQPTTKTSGYHTNSSQQREIIVDSLSLAKSMLLETTEAA